MPDFFAAGHTTGVNHLAVDHHTGGAHDAVTHDVAQFFNFGQGDFNTLGFGDLVDQCDGIFAVGTAGAEYFDVYLSSLTLT